jgi:hypothetical protein
LTQDQVSDNYVVAWIRERLQEDCCEYERSQTVPEQLDALHLTLMDVLHVLRTADTVIRDRYAGGCLIVRGKDLDDGVLSVVVAPPSAKNRVRVVKIWRD